MFEVDNIKTPVFVIYDTQCKTWNIHTCNRECIYFGSIEQIEAWLVDNEKLYYEERN